MSAARGLATLASGVLFGFGLSYSTMIRPEVVLSFLRFQDFGLMLVMGGAMTVVLLVYKLAPRLLRLPSRLRPQAVIDGIGLERNAARQKRRRAQHSQRHAIAPARYRQRHARRIG